MLKLSLFLASEWNRCATRPAIKIPLSTGNDHPFLIGRSFAFLGRFTMITFLQIWRANRFCRFAWDSHIYFFPSQNVQFQGGQPFSQLDFGNRLPPEGPGLEEDLQRHHWHVLLQEVLLACDTWESVPGYKNWKGGPQMTRAHWWRAEMSCNEKSL